MKIVLLIALALFAAGPVRYADLDDFLRRAEELASRWRKPKPLCICLDGSELHTRMGTLEVTQMFDSVIRVRALCPTSAGPRETTPSTAPAPTPWCWQSGRLPRSPMPNL